ncbi:GDP-mannose 4,6-dehydratase [Candidatus Campbellbacteria bacterium RIFCSPLOWO2_01_FULL_34_15]|uniref:GDP-mannose 4,6-dehydratase n=1 Tax=Candidatus Campbellbacteria bacterium RIFCSPLOWO2_01_FULL_34_15 TaxID=1797579 RepID=A0A1F5ELE7_9BACT|nr:MAG: GDP-mannose 4,6-dehydratase [Candidatus Campbellbacteria bacterium RIFCSPLOWO2_01_FULL_34_15]
MKKALITGITGQDGSYLAELLIEKGYEVHGFVRRSSTFNRKNIEHIFDTEEKREKFLHYGDMTDINSLISVLKKVEPDEIYNLAAQSHVKISFEIPFYTAQSDAIGVLNILEAVRILKMDSKIYQASTSELYNGDSKLSPQNENTPFKPKSPYGVAKLYGFEIARVYRESYGMFVCNGILFNHESPRRGTNFVTRKVTKGVAEIKLGLREKISIGNLDAKRDWGFALEYMEAAWMMLQQDKPDDYVICTGENHSVREFIEESFKCIDIDIEWKGKGLGEIGVNKKTGDILVSVNSDYFRPNEVDYLKGDQSKAKEKLGWNPKVKYKELVKMMVDSDLKILTKENE